MTYTVKPLEHIMYGQSYGTDWQLLEDGEVIGVIYSEDTARAVVDVLNQYEMEREAVSDGSV